MNARETEGFRRKLLQQRQQLFNEVSHLEADLETIAQERETEFEEAAHEERTARLLAQLDDRGKAELQEIDRALFRMANKRYGRCEGCGKPILHGRLAALPATPHCRDCAQRVERGQPARTEGAEAAHSASVPPDYSLLTGREMEEALREQLCEDGRVDLEELRVVCRHGVVYLDGSVPSQAAHQILLHTITDVMGLSEIVDRVQAKEILWEREERDREVATPAARPWDESYGTEDITELHEAGTDFVAPTRPGPDEE